MTPYPPTVPSPASPESIGANPTSPPGVLSGRQKMAGVLAVVALIAALAIRPVATAVLVNGALILFFAAANVLKLVLIHRSLTQQDGAIDIRDGESPILDEALPYYTILLPVYREISVLPQLVHGIEQLDYPAHLLDVKLLLETDDLETQAAVAGMALPDCFEILVVPDEGPTGKPRACNYGLEHARGDFLVIFDAEDRPEPDQLRKAVAAFGRADPSVVCLQAKLNYFNRGYNVLTRLFTAEYSMLFDQILPGLQAFDAVIPLGGTSNHFDTARLRELGGWNVFNVTEDADLGVRIFLRGWKTAVLESTTYEEANSRYGNWIRQRSRWVKGHMQTYLYHMRHPVRVARHMGVKTFLIFQLFFGAGTLCLIVNPIYWALAVWWYTAHPVFISDLFPRPFLYIGTLALFVGNGAFVLTAIAGCFGRKNFDDVKWAVLTPLYMVLLSIGAWKGFIQLLYKPLYWEKTIHGYCQIEPDANSSDGAPTLASREAAR